MSERWKPKNGETYFYFNPNSFSDVSWKRWGIQTHIDHDLYQNGNCFRTRAKAESAAKKVKELLLSWHEPATDCSQLPKLTTEVFDRSDCPEWAEWAAVDRNGKAYFYHTKPEWEQPSQIRKHQTIWFTGKLNGIKRIPGKFDAANWHNSLIKRPTKLPEWWCKVGEWVYDSIRERYRKIIRIDMTIKGCSPVIFFNEDADLLFPSMQINSIAGRSLKQARLRPYNADEMKALVGKVIERYSSAYLVISYAHDDLETTVYIEGKYLCADNLLRDFTINGKPCGVLEHLNENGEWVR